jgi:hypothetical protein
MNRPGALLPHPACRSEPQPKGARVRPPHAFGEDGCPTIRGTRESEDSPGGLVEPLLVERTTTLHTSLTSSGPVPDARMGVRSQQL